MMRFELSGPQILGAINSGKLKEKERPEGVFSGKKFWKIERQELQRYFKELGEVPEFLKE